jgi:hypothetical protein
LSGKVAQAGNICWFANMIPLRVIAAEQLQALQLLG